MTRPQPRVRRAGSKWRLLVHQWLGKGEAYGTAHDLRNYPQDVIRPLEMDDAEYADYQAKVDGCEYELCWREDRAS